MVAALVVGVIHGVHAHVDDHASLLDHVSLHEVGDAHSGDDDVRLLQMLLQVSSAGVADRHGCVAVQEKHGNRDAQDVAATNHHSVLSSNLHVVAVEQLDAALRRAGNSERIATLHGELADVQGVEAIHVLLDGNGVQDAFLVDVLGERKLHKDSVDIRIRVQLHDRLQQVFLHLSGWDAEILRKYPRGRCNRRE